jgi:hypothetical protein
MKPFTSNETGGIILALTLNYANIMETLCKQLIYRKHCTDY